MSNSTAARLLLLTALLLFGVFQAKANIIETLSLGPGLTVEGESSYSLYLGTSELVSLGGDGDYLTDSDCPAPYHCSLVEDVSLSGPADMSVNDSYEYIGRINDSTGYGLSSPCGSDYTAAGPLVTCTMPPGNYDLTLSAYVVSEKPFTVNLAANLTGDFVLTPEPSTALLLLVPLIAFFLKRNSTRRSG